MNQFKIKIRSGKNTSWLSTFSKPDIFANLGSFSFEEDTVFNLIEKNGDFMKVSVDNQQFWMSKSFPLIEV